MPSQVVVTLRSGERYRMPADVLLRLIRMTPPERLGAGFRLANAEAVERLEPQPSHGAPRAVGFVPASMHYLRAESIETIAVG